MSPSNPEIDAYFSDPLNFPLAFKQWLVAYLEVNQPYLIVSQLSQKGLASDSALAGMFDGAGNIQGGNGFTVTRTALGKYDVAYTQAYAASPIVVCQAYNSSFSSYFPSLYVETVTGFSVCNINASGAFVDQGISFLVSAPI